MSEIDWHSDPWFAKHHADSITDDFKAWWLDFYGPPTQYVGNPWELKTYWVRCAFAWHGWKGRGY